MKIEKLKSNKAVTMTILVITIIVLLIISSTIIVTTRNDEDVSRINSLYADIILLRNKILLYYNKYGELPLLNKVNFEGFEDSEEYDDFYKIDLSKLDNLTLHYGDEKDEEGNSDLIDFYVLNERTLNVYYYPGILFEGEMIYTNTSYVDTNNKSKQITLVEYILGEDHEGRSLLDILEIESPDEDHTYYTFKNEYYDEENTKLKFDASNLILLDNHHSFGQGYELATDFDWVRYIRYNNDLYKFNFTVDMEKEELVTKPLGDELVPLVYKDGENENLGKIVDWDSDNDGVTEEWIVLYDDRSNGLQIISKNSVGYPKETAVLKPGMVIEKEMVPTDIGFGTNDWLINWDDVEELEGISGDTLNKEKAIYSYNRAIETLNNACNDLIINRDLVDSVRSVGSNPINSNAENNYILAEGDRVENFKLYSNRLSDFAGGISNGRLKPGDLNFVDDWDRMIALNISSCNNPYWLASREVEDEGDSITFGIRVASWRNRSRMAPRSNQCSLYCWN